MDTSFWESLRLGFVKLREDCAINPPLSPAGHLTAIWISEREPEWRLDYWNGSDGSGVGQRFKWHAESAAARLGCADRDEAALAFWLDAVRRDAPKSHI